MDLPPTPKPMKKVSRNPLQKIEKKLRKFEGNLKYSDSAYRTGSAISLNELPDDYNPSVSQQDDTVSLRSVPEQNFETPQVYRRSKVATDRFSTSSTTSIGSNQWQQDVDKNDGYDMEMRIVCQSLMENKTINLYDWRSFDKKVALLRAALTFNTPNVMGPVLIFLENTLAKPIFYELISKHPSAVKNYLNLLKYRPDTEKQLVALKSFGHNQDVAMMYLKKTEQTNDVHQKIFYLDQAAIELAAHPWWQRQVAEYQHLLHKQRELKTSINSPKIENQTTLETYKAVYDIDFRQQRHNRSMSSSIVQRSQDLEATFRMSPELVMCGKLSVIMHFPIRTYYDDFFHQAFHQGFLGKKYIVSPENLVDMIYNWARYNGESIENAGERAGKFLNMINDPQRRIYFAEKVHHYDIAINTIVTVLRDRNQLENLRKRIPPTHPSFQKATNLLDTVKWKN